jgi:hypothetical protein
MCMAAYEVVRKMAAEIVDPTDLWRPFDSLTEKRDRRRSVPPSSSPDLSGRDGPGRKSRRASPTGCGDMVRAVVGFGIES